MTGPGRQPAPPLVDPTWLHAHTPDPSVVLLEVGDDATSYHIGHLPGAGSLDWTEELQEPVRRGFVGRDRFQAVMTAKGVHRDSHVVLYAAHDPVYAAYAFWLLRYYRHPRISLLDGGKTGWTATGQPLVDTLPTPTAPTGPMPYTGVDPDPTVRATRDDILTDYVNASGDHALLDCRTPGEYDGHPSHRLDLPLERHRVTGHIPGARNLPSALLLDPTGHFRPLPELRALFADRGVHAGSDLHVALYCRDAERSSLLWFALHELLAHPHVRNYDGGWAEYGSLVHAPVER